MASVYQVGLFGWYSKPEQVVVKSKDEPKKLQETKSANDKKAKKHE